jgi:hypothetical protein
MDFPAWGIPNSRMRVDLANLANNIDTLHGMIVTQAADFTLERQNVLRRPRPF